MKRSAPQLVVADAGPLIGLAIVGGLTWLEALFREVLDALTRARYRLADELSREILRLAGEAMPPAAPG